MKNLVTIIITLIMFLPVFANDATGNDKSPLKNIIDEGYRLYEQELYSDALECYTKESDMEMGNARNSRMLKELLDVMEKPQDNIEKEKTDKRNDIGLDADRKIRLINKILSVMEDVEVICKPDFNLNTLVSMVESNTSYVSWCINEAFGKNFKTLLNEYRIREASRRLSDSKKYGNMAIQAIYEDLGYKSASNFIKAFKNVIGMTPSMYLKLKNEENME